MSKVKQISDSEKDSILNPKNWESTDPKDRMFTSDHVIDSYLIGKEVGADQQAKLIVEKLQSNAQLASNHTTEIAGVINQLGIKIYNAFLRVENWDHFEIMFIISEDDFLSDKMDNVYSEIIKFEKNIATDLYKLSFKFCDIENIDELNVSCLTSDGFRFQHPDFK